MEFAESISCKGCNVAFTPKKTRRAMKYCSRECLDLSKGREKHYGINRAEMEFILATQDDACAICHTTEDVRHVDHCHDTGKVRGVLCSNCNTALGLLKDDTAAMRRAIGYVTHAEFVRP